MHPGAEKELDAQVADVLGKAMVVVVLLAIGWGLGVILARLL